MMIRASSVVLFIGGFMLWFFAQIIPFFKVLGMDWVGQFMQIGGLVILIYCFGPSGVGMLYDTIPVGTAVINYIRRDGIITSLLGKRIFSGESFLDVPRLGIVEDVGKDTVFSWGKKKVRFGLENINYTPDPRYWNMCRELYQLGFDDTDDLYNVMNIPNMDNEADKAKKVYYLERMANIYWKMKHQQPRGGEKIVKNFMKKPEKHTSFGNRRHKRFKEEPRVEEKTAPRIVEKPSEPIPIPPVPTPVSIPEPKPTSISGLSDDDLKRLAQLLRENQNE